MGPCSGASLGRTSETQRYSLSSHFGTRRRPSLPVRGTTLEALLQLLYTLVQALDLLLKLLEGAEARQDGTHALVQVVLHLLELLLGLIDQGGLGVFGGGLSSHFDLLLARLPARDEPPDGPLAQVGEHLFGTRVNELLERLERDVARVRLLLFVDDLREGDLGQVVLGVVVDDLDFLAAAHHLG